MENYLKNTKKHFLLLILPSIGGKKELQQKGKRINSIVYQVHIVFTEYYFVLFYSKGRDIWYFQL